MIMKRRAFTLVEFMVAASIALFVLTAAISSYVFYWRCFFAGNTFLDIYSNSRVAVGWMSKDFKWGSQVILNHTVTATSTTYTTAADCMVVEVPSVDASGDFIPSQFDKIIYRVESDKLYRIVDPATASSVRTYSNSAIASHCGQLVFRASGPTSGGMQDISYYTSPTDILSSINTIYVALPLSEQTVFSTPTAGGGASLRPTTVIKMRNKQ